MDPGYSANTGLALTHTYAYDTNGNLTSTAVQSTTGHVPRRATTAAMFAHKRYPQQITNAAGHGEAHTYDACFGLPKSSTDANGQTVSREYDPFGRESRFTTRDGVAISTRYRWCGTDLTCGRVDNVDPVMAVETDSTISPRTVVYLDSLGRRVRTETESFDGASVDRVDIVHDERGRVFRVSSPYEAVGAGGRADTYDTEHDYDIRDRVRKLNRPDGGHLNIDRRACGNETQETVRETVYDDAGTRVATRTRVSRYNLMGELVRVTEGGGTASDTCSLPAGLTDAVTTSYAYNGSGQLRTVSVNVEEMGNQVAKTVASFAYDAAGNRSRSSHDDAGQVDLSYTALGELRTRTHAQKSGRNATYIYDLLGRVTTATDSSGSSHWEYDGGTTGNGFLSRRCGMSDAMATGCSSSASFNETYAYNTDARLSSTVTKVVSGSTTRTFTHSYGYDSNGRLSTTSHPSGLTTRREYNSRGYLSRVLDNGASKELLAYVDRDPWGNATRERLGNGGFVTRTFDAASGRQTRQDVRLKGKLRHDALYEWRSDGLLKERSVRGVLDDGTTTGYREESFVHDGLGRLTQAAATSGAVTRTLTTSYDVLGNLLSKTSSVTGDVDVTGYNYTGTLNAVRYAKVGSARHQYSYDASGRMTSDKQCLQLTGTCTSSTETDELNDRYISWDSRGLATRVVVGSGLTDTTPMARETFRHGPDEARFERFSEWKDGETTQSIRTYYVGAYEKSFPESDADTASVERTRLPGGVVHVKATPTTGNATEVFEYRHVDHLGSVVAVSDATAAPLAVLGHDPFGDRRLADWKRGLTAAEAATLSGRRTARGFTGHEQLDRTGLVHMSGRLYDPRLGRFLSADRYVANPAIGQDWNRYSYVSNSPMSYVDPTGYVRAGPGCNVDGVFCAGPEQGGGFTRTAQPFEHAGHVEIAVPYVSVSWGPVYGAWGSDYGLPVLAPRYTVHVSTFAVPFVFSGSLSVDGESPADEPLFTGRAAVSIGVGALPVAGTVQSVVEVITGHDYITDEDVHRGIAAAGIIAGVVPGGKAVLRAGVEVAGRTSRAGLDLLNPPIRINDRLTGHVLPRHTSHGPARFAGKSKFNESEDLEALILRATQAPMVRQPSGNYARTIDVGRNIGFDRTAQQQTSVLTVITTPSGDLVTAFPGAP